MTDKTKIKLLNMVIAFLLLSSIFIYLDNRSMRREYAKLHFLVYTPGQLLPKEQKSMLLPGIILTDVRTGRKSGILDGVNTGKVLICVFSTDCFSCDQASLTWNEIYNRYGGTYTIRGISKDEPTAIDTYIKRNRVEFPVFQYEISSLTEIFTSLPQTILADKNGNIILSFSGIPGELEARLKELK